MRDEEALHPGKVGRSKQGGKKNKNRRKTTDSYTVHILMLKGDSGCPFLTIKGIPRE